MVALTEIHDVTAKRWDRGWELHIARVGVTQAGTLAQADRMIRDYIELATGQDGASVHYNLQTDLGPLLVQVDQLRETQGHAYTWQSNAAAQARTLVKDMRHAGFAGSDIAAVLGISQQRVSQLTQQ